eukprot:m.36004 g.36004  ORF g.36004 m.36004 type:complete len:337 (-) comp12825_c0_seq2:107-1117(-)
MGVVGIIEHECDSLVIQVCERALDSLGLQEEVGHHALNVPDLDSILLADHREIVALHVVHSQIPFVFVVPDGVHQEVGGVCVGRRDTQVMARDDELLRRFDFVLPRLEHELGLPTNFSGRQLPPIRLVHPLDLEWVVQVLLRLGGTLHAACPHQGQGHPARWLEIALEFLDESVQVEQESNVTVVHNANEQNLGGRLQEAPLRLHAEAVAVKVLKKDVRAKHLVEPKHKPTKFEVLGNDKHRDVPNPAAVSSRHCAIRQDEGAGSSRDAVERSSVCLTRTTQSNFVLQPAQRVEMVVKMVAIEVEVAQRWGSPSSCTTATESTTGKEWVTLSKDNL